MEPIVEVRNLCKTFGHGKTSVEAVKPLSFTVEKGECFGIIGESGSGKSTLANMIIGLQKPTSGTIDFYGEHMQMIFQNPVASFSPKMCLLDAIVEGSRYHAKESKKELRARALHLMKRVGLPESYRNKTCREISGGEAQRAAIARALMIEPELLLCDEPTSALDVTIQAKIIALLMELKESCKMSYVFISHDIGLVSQVCDRLMVMCKGEVVESGKTEEILKAPKEAYTKQLLDAII
ncbi:dipeptide transport system ATP-binding protein [Lachnospiraceae bacterium XBB1006]|nr:dipeptide transport system ATP-binding protein [Lachnospiraceae bacterium XBB1006]